MVRLAIVPGLVRARDATDGCAYRLVEIVSRQMLKLHDSLVNYFGHYTVGKTTCVVLIDWVEFPDRLTSLRPSDSVREGALE
eukprot:1564048-Heterocapsa_arctica.AAC.1